MVRVMKIMGTSFKRTSVCIVVNLFVRNELDSLQMLS